MKKWLIAIGLLLVLHPFRATAQEDETREARGSVDAGKIVDIIIRISDFGPIFA
jgi:hypothetical protein